MEQKGQCQKPRGSNTRPSARGLEGEEDPEYPEEGENDPEDPGEEQPETPAEDPEEGSGSWPEEDPEEPEQPDDGTSMVKTLLAQMKKIWR